MPLDCHVTLAPEQLAELRRSVAANHRPAPGSTPVRLVGGPLDGLRVDMVLPSKVDPTAGWGWCLPTDRFLAVAMYKPSGYADDVWTFDELVNPQILER